MNIRVSLSCPLIYTPIELDLYFTLLGVSLFSFASFSAHLKFKHGHFPIVLVHYV